MYTCEHLGIKMWKNRALCSFWFKIPSLLEKLRISLKPGFALGGFPIIVYDFSAWYSYPLLLKKIDIRYREDVRTFQFDFNFNIYILFHDSPKCKFLLWSKFGWLLVVAAGWWIRGASATDRAVLEFGNIPWDFNVLCPKKFKSPRSTIVRRK